MNDLPSGSNPERTSARKAASNRRNASKSTGPRTAQGKANSRLNALKHGILASQAVIAIIEGRAERKMFEQIVDGLAEDFQPVGTYEQLLVQEVAACFWRKRRLLMFETHAAFEVHEQATNAYLSSPREKTAARRAPYLMGGGVHPHRLCLAENVYQEAGLDRPTLPSEADTMRIVRYEAAINRTRERAVASLREMRKARRGASSSPQQNVVAIDRKAARRNASRQQVTTISPMVAMRVWNKLSEAGREVVQRELEEAERDAVSKNDETKPKNLTAAERTEIVRKSLREGLSRPVMPDEPEEDPNKPRSE
jgi:hypothetical protein